MAWLVNNSGLDKGFISIENEAWGVFFFLQKQEKDSENKKKIS